MQIANCKMKKSGHRLSARVTVRSAPALGKPYDLSERLLEFADRVASVVEALPETRLGRRIADQLIRSGTSPLANYEEACAAESKSDFAHKLRICLKEVRESRAWLQLVARRNLLPAIRLEDLIDEADQLARIMGQSIATARGVQKKSRVGNTNGS